MLWEYLVNLLAKGHVSGEQMGESKGGEGESVRWLKLLPFFFAVAVSTEVGPKCVWRPPATLLGKTTLLSERWRDRNFLCSFFGSFFKS